jgi:uncharacterized protein (DUF58 family)
VILFYYGGTSEVAWLYMLSYLVGGLMVASFFYALWNYGFRGEVYVIGTQPMPGSPRDDLPEYVLRDSPSAHAVFEGDRLDLKIRLVNHKGTRGPAQLIGVIGLWPVATAAAVVPKKEGWSERTTVGPLRRGPLMAHDFKLSSTDLLGLFARRTRSQEKELTLVLPRFTSLGRVPQVRELEASLSAPRTGSGTELFGVREYRRGDPLRRIHWRSSARHAELIVREFEPPGVQSLLIICDPKPPSTEAADQIARLAASEAWDCIRSGGRVALWAPGAEPTRRDEERNLWAMLEWLARYPTTGQTETAPQPMRDAVAVIATAEPRVVEAIDTVKARGGSVRAWVVGDAVPEIDAEVQRAGLGWPL